MLPLGPTAAGRRPPPSPTCRQPRSSVPALKAALAPRCIALPLTTGSAPSTEIADLEPKSHGNSRSGPRARRRETESAERSGGAGAGRHRASRVLFPKPAATAPGRVAFAHRTKGGGWKRRCPQPGPNPPKHVTEGGLPLGRAARQAPRPHPHPAPRQGNQQTPAGTTPPPPWIPTLGAPAGETPNHKGQLSSIGGCLQDLASESVRNLLNKDGRLCSFLGIKIRSQTLQDPEHGLNIHCNTA